MHQAQEGAEADLGRGDVVLQGGLGGQGGHQVVREAAMTHLAHLVTIQGLELVELSINRTPWLGCRLISGPVWHHKSLIELCVCGTCEKYFI